VGGISLINFCINVPMRAAIIASLVSSAAAGLATPCVAPPGVVPVVNESLCFTTIVPTNPSGVTIRQYGADANATFASSGANGPFPSGLQGSIAGVISYFAGSNDEQRNILSARTVPFAILPAISTPTWQAFMEVSPTQFPDDFLIPRPAQRNVGLSKVNDNIGNTLMASFQFNTTGFPYLENIQEACGVIQNSTLPSGYAVNTTHPWSPTYVFYNGQADVNYTSECWMAVYKTA
jgi:hypothetical protein